jgi:hypothetical protein
MLHREANTPWTQLEQQMAATSQKIRQLTHQIGQLRVSIN